MATLAEIDRAFRLYVDKSDGQGSTDFLPGERLQFINDAQVRLARTIVSRKVDNQDAVDLRRSLSRFKDIPISGPSVNLPDDYLHYGRCRVQLAPPYQNYNVRVTIVSEDELSDLLQDEFNTPTIGEPVACFLHNTVVVYPRNAFSSFELSYYKLPKVLVEKEDVCELVEALIPTLVQYAVQLALESVESTRTNTQAQIASATAA